MVACHTAEHSLRRSCVVRHICDRLKEGRKEDRRGGSHSIGCHTAQPSDLVLDEGIERDVKRDEGEVDDKEGEERGEEDVRRERE